MKSSLKSGSVYSQIQGFKQEMNQKNLMRHWIDQKRRLTKKILKSIEKKLKIYFLGTLSDTEQ